MSDSDPTESETERVRRILADTFDDRVYAVETTVVWVSGMNAGCSSVARRMARTLVAHDIPCGLVYTDATQFDGVQFNWGASA